MTLRKNIKALAALFLPLALTSCSWVLENSLPTRPYLKPGKPREEVIAVLGKPRSSARLSPPQPAACLPNVEPEQRSARATLRDEYFVSSLVQMPGDAYESEDNIYPAIFLLTGGLVEVIALPFETVDLTYRSVRHRHLWLWYDRSGALITYCRK